MLQLMLTTCYVFQRYYTWDPKIANEAEAKASVITHMHKNFRHLPSDDKDGVIEIIKTKGRTYADHRPSYINPDVWDTLCKYWDSEIFRKRSATGKAARKKVEVPHTSGATSFETRRQDYREKNGGDLDYTIVYKDCHTLKDEKRKGKWISKKAKRIMIRYKKICKKKGVDPKQTQIQSWVEAIGGVRKNTILDFPRVKSCDVLGSELRSPPPRKGEGGSGRSDMARIHDDMFMRVVDETLAQARANPDEYMLTPEQIRLLARDVLDGDSSLPPDHPIARETRQSIITVAIEVLNNIHRREGPVTKGKAPMDEDDDEMEGGMDDGGDDMDDEEDDGMDDEEDDGLDDEDDHDDDGNDMDDEDDYDDGGMGDYEDMESDEDRDMSSPPCQVISKGGPKIIG
ncbi:hypothetical protein POM88_003323 [Heracleum sosnowskyi]|uniref:Uncharacterized protein n=1 Tax=Heracleum sosnowskyi TaxID=360622 RepID=A0AAD8JH92_9APIA|nr:hypothetical protein POM88_003323 [Heracleum sosnowskyi]